MAESNNDHMINELKNKLGVDDVRDIILDDVNGSDIQHSISIKTVLGYGGFGYVVGAYDRQLNEDIALKIMHKNWKDKSLDTLRFEAELLQKI